MTGQLSIKKTKDTFLIMCSLSLDDSSSVFNGPELDDKSVNPEDRPFILTHLIKESPNGCSFFMKGPQGLERFDLKGELAQVSRLMDGSNTVSEISHRLGIPFDQVARAVSFLLKYGLVHIE